MSALQRFKQRIFGTTAGFEQIAKFGSLAASAPEFTTDPDEAQSLSAWIEGWFGAVLGNNSPAIEDMNATFFVITYQLAYLLERGVPEWNVDTTYFTGSMVNSAGIIYISKVDDNIGNAITDSAFWKVVSGTSRGISLSGPALITDDVLRVDTTSGALTVTLPTIATSVGKRITIKNIGTNDCIVNGNGSELIDGSNSYTSMHDQYDSITVFNNGTTWDTI